MLYTFRQRLRKVWFSAACRTIASTGPIYPTNTGLQIVSMVSHHDVTMFLIAIKSLYARIRHGAVCILNDGTLTSRDMALLKMHISPCVIIPIDAVDTANCPTGGTWERHLFIADAVGDNYVIQLDSDTLTLGPIQEVLRCIDENRSFSLGTSMGREISPLVNVSTQMKTYPRDHVQVAAEQELTRLPDSHHLKYVRGCSGFAGFARGSFNRIAVQDFSRKMETILGKTWHEWGSEQVSSNFIIANSPKAAVLPFPRYANFHPQIPYKDSTFLHFIGPHRFVDNAYIRKARGVIAELHAA